MVLAQPANASMTPAASTERRIEGPRDEFGAKDKRVMAVVRWSLIVLQFLAYCAAGTWITVAIQLVQLRQQSGQPWAIAAIILGSVALLTLLAGLLLNSRAIMQRYPD